MASLWFLWCPDHGTFWRPSKYDRCHCGFQTNREIEVDTFKTGATRDGDLDKLDYEGFFSPLVLERFAQYMHACRKLPDGTIRDADNWQLGIPKWRYVKSLVRHTLDLWRGWRSTRHEPGYVDQTLACAIMFNVMGLLHESLREQAPVPTLEAQIILNETVGEQGDVW